MVVRAKFQLTEQTNRAGWKKREDGKPSLVTTVVFQAVSDSEGENKKFWEATPAGRIELTCVNPEAIAELELLRTYYVDFTPVE